MGRKSTKKTFADMAVHIGNLFGLNRRAMAPDMYAATGLQIRDYLLARDMPIDAWYEIATNFFVESRKHFSRLEIRNQLALKCQFDPLSMDDERQQKRLWEAVAKRHFISDHTITRWTNGTYDPPLETLLSMCSGLGVSLMNTAILDEAKSTRFAFARLLAFTGCFPWDRCPEPDHQLNVRVGDEIRRHHPAYFDGKSGFGRFINQTVFDWLLLRIPEANFPTRQLGRIRKSIESTRDSSISWYWPYSIAKHMMFYRISDDNMIPDAWLWNEDHDLYKPLWSDSE